MSAASAWSVRTLYSVASTSSLYVAPIFTPSAQDETSTTYLLDLVAAQDKTIRSDNTEVYTDSLYLVTSDQSGKAIPHLSLLQEYRNMAAMTEPSIPWEQGPPISRSLLWESLGKADV